MTNFKDDYRKLLLRQVDEEILFLRQSGHREPTISQPCIFCTNYGKEKYVCNRIEILNDFKDTINKSNNSKIKFQQTITCTPISRRPMGGIENPAPAPLNPTLPLMFPKL